jgi:hypothetical protein
MTNDLDTESGRITCIIVSLHTENNPLLPRHNQALTITVASMGNVLTQSKTAEKVELAEASAVLVGFNFPDWSLRTMAVVRPTEPPAGSFHQSMATREHLGRVDFVVINCREVWGLPRHNGAKAATGAALTAGS